MMKHLLCLLSGILGLAAMAAVLNLLVPLQGTPVVKALSISLNEPWIIYTVSNGPLSDNQPIMMPKTETRFVEPGAYFVYTLLLTNTDNISHTFDVVSSSWLWICDIPTTVGPIAPYSSAPLEVTICVFPYALGYETSVVDVTATAADDVLLSVTSTLTTTVTPYWNVQLFAFTAAFSASPGTTVTYPLRIYNCGNVSDTYHLSYYDNVWDSRLSITETQLVGLGRFCIRGDLLAYVTIPSTATLGTTDTLQIIAVGTGISATLTLTTTAAAVTYLPVVMQNHR
jgi:DNA-directed RNA polymerase subunit N (RpoN/RPB10)